MRILRIMILLLIGLMFMSMQCLAKHPEESYQSFSVTFEQDGKVIKPNDHIINLQKKGFAIGVTFRGYEGETVAVRLNASINDDYYNIARAGLPVTELFADGIAMAEKAGAKYLILNTKCVQYLYHNSSSKSSFSTFHEVTLNDNTMHGKRYITEYTFVNGNVFPIESLKVNELYMVFLKRGSTGLQQEYYRIQFQPL